MSANTKVLVLLLLLALGAAVMYTVFTIGAIVALFLLSLLFAFILSPAVSWCERQGIPRTLSAVVVFVLFFGGVTTLLYVLAPFLYEEVSRLQEIITVGQLRRGVRDMEVFLSRQLSFLGVRRLHVAPKVEEWVGVLFDNLIGIASGVVGIVLFLVMMLISTFFLLKDSRSLKRVFVELVPNRFFEVTLNVLHKIEWSLGAYLRGILLDALAIGVLTTFALWLIDLPSFFLVGLIAAAANLVPYLGPPTAGCIAMVISVMSRGDFEQVPIIILVFSLIRLIDDAIVQPLTISASVRLHPLIIIFALLIGGQLFGIIGMLFAVPAVGVLKVFMTEVYAGMNRYRPSHESR